MVTWDDIMWQPGRTSCRFCSSRRQGEKPAAYDLWYEVKGWLLTDYPDQGPHCMVMPLCAECTALERAEKHDGVMDLVLVRTLKS